jgi:hypothetical protein
MREQHIAGTMPDGLSLQQQSHSINKSCCIRKFRARQIYEH